MNRKLKLSLDELTIDSFDTTRPAAKNGTVFGEQCTCYTQCTCPGCPTCYASCNGTCAGTCANTCANTCDDATCGCGTGYTCDQTACGCYPETSCFNTGCGNQECCI
ncbi:MAG TPA: hypothetical protein VE871_05510 [Longimicrobium sp.]|nr:hypothetical protein [Longimicrobium sp.]